MLTVNKMAQDAPTISIVTPSLNQGRFLSETIESVIGQRGNFSIDYTIMDGGSTDNSIDIIRGYNDRLHAGAYPLECQHVNMRWVSEPDLGPGDAVNKGFRSATGAIVAFINSDDLYEQGALQHVLNRFAENPDVEIIYGHGLSVSEENIIEDLYPTKDVNVNSLLDRCWICQPALFMRMKTWLAAGEFRTDLIAFDYEYWLRLKKRGLIFHFTDRVLARTRMHADTKRRLHHRAIVLECLELTRTKFGYNRIWLKHYLLELTIPGRFIKHLIKFMLRRASAMRER